MKTILTAVVGAALIAGFSSFLVFVLTTGCSTIPAYPTSSTPDAGPATPKSQTPISEYSSEELCEVLVYGLCKAEERCKDTDLNSCFAHYVPGCAGVTGIELEEARTCARALLEGPCGEFPAVCQDLGEAPGYVPPEAPQPKGMAL